MGYDAEWRNYQKWKVTNKTIYIENLNKNRDKIQQTRKETNKQLGGLNDQA